jgi:hypothetical protein
MAYGRVWILGVLIAARPAAADPELGGRFGVGYGAYAQHSEGYGSSTHGPIVGIGGRVAHRIAPSVTLGLTLDLDLIVRGTETWQSPDYPHEGSASPTPNVAVGFGVDWTAIDALGLGAAVAFGGWPMQSSERSALGLQAQLTVHYGTRLGPYVRLVAAPALDYPIGVDYLEEATSYYSVDVGILIRRY